MAATGRKVGSLAALVGGSVSGDAETVVTDVTHDSRQAGPGSLFVAIVGSNHDGHDFVAAAVDAGSPAVMVEREMAVGRPQIVVADTRRAMAPVAAEVHDQPSRRLRLVGVTGTNGKTTITHMLESIVNEAGVRAGLIGTVHTRVGDTNIPSTRTTPESSDFQRLLARMAQMGAQVVSAEVSSHALELHRVDASWFSVAAFSNLSQDHLDFHGDMERYFAAKARLFDPERAQQAVINVDDPAGRRLADEVRIPTVTVGQRGDFHAREVRAGLDRSRFVLIGAGAELEMELAMGGEFNVDNAVMATACAHALQLDLTAARDALARFEGIPGRFELVSGDHPVRVVVDYAHTPAGIARAVSTARAAADVSGRIILLFGAGGDRDRAKRPHMGAAAAGADIVVVTSDNPRSEDPEVIIDEVMAGLGEPARPLRLVDRRQAIRAAIAMAEPGDTVLILGKGHERGQEIGGRVLPFDDRLIAREALAERGSAS